jgi:hypothetical protein
MSNEIQMTKAQISRLPGVMGVWNLLFDLDFGFELSNLTFT